MIPSFLIRRLELARGAWLRDVLLIYLAADVFDENSFSTVVTADIKENLEPEEVLVLVRDSVFGRVIDVLTDSLIIQQLYGLRLNSRVPITLLSFDASGQEARRQAYPAGAVVSDVSIDEIRRRLITAIFRDRRGFVESTASYHFENPSGKHTERFIRLSNILHTTAEVSFLALCALPHVSADTSAIYVDTPSLFSLTSAINDHLRSLAPERPPIFVESFGSYEGVPTFRFDELLYSIVIISASSSGSLGALLVDEHGFERNQIIHFLYLGPPQDDLLVVGDLSFDALWNPDGFKERPSKQKQGACTLCKAGSFAIPLRGDQFEPAGPQVEPIYLRNVDAPAGLRSLVGGMAARQIFGVGLGRKNFDEPRLYNINPAFLTDSERFSTDLEYVTRRSTPAGTAHVVYLDSGSRLFAERVADHVAQNSPRPLVLAKEELERIPENTKTPVVVVSAVIESGRSLLDVSRDLRPITPDTPLTYIIGVNKTTGEERRESLAKNLSQTHAPAAHEVISVERIILPLSHEDHAWSREIDVLKEIVQNGAGQEAEREFVLRRLERLSDRNVILHDDVFLPSPLSASLAIRPGFVFGQVGSGGPTLSQADVYFTISSVLQGLRANSERPGARALRSNWFQQTILAPDNFSRFNDGIIQASFLRAATPTELNYIDRRDLSGELARIVHRILVGGRSPKGEAALEFLMALATKRLSLHNDDVREVLNVPKELPALELELVKACKRNL